MSDASSVLVVDWSAASRPSPAQADSIWIGEASADGHDAPPRPMPTRRAAEDWLTGRLAAALDRGERVLLGFDFAFGYPAGFAGRVAGEASAFALWAHLAALIADGADNGNNRFAVAEAINAAFGAAPGPFWGRPAHLDHPLLPTRRRVDLAALGLAPHRATERWLRREGGAGRAVKSVWQLAYAGAVGSQVLTGLPVLHRLRRRFAGAVSVWPFDAPAAPITLAEVYPALIDRRVQASSLHPVKDARQVALLAAGFAALAAGGQGLAPLFDLPPLAPAERAAVLREEGWILGAGQAPALLAALSRRSP